MALTVNFDRTNLVVASATQKALHPWKSWQLGRKYMQRSLSQIMDTDYGVETGTLAKARLIEEVAVRTLSDWRELRQSLFEQLIDSGNSGSV
jgi:hypothetical protein